MKKHIQKKEHALILGASGEIGAAVAERMASSGIKALTLTYGSNLKPVEKLAKKLKARYGAKVYIARLAFPLQDEDIPLFEELLDTAVRKNGAEITVAVNTIGISPNEDYRKQKLGGKDGVRHVYEVNVFSAAVTMRSIANRMEKKGIKGAIVQIASTNGVNSQACFIMSENP